MKKLLSAALSLMMVLTSLTAVPRTAFADTHPAAKWVTIGDKQNNSFNLSSDKPCCKNGATEPTAETEGANVIYDENTGILQLNNYDGGVIRFNDFGDVTIRLTGTNPILGNQFGIYQPDGNVTITAEKAATLDVTNVSNDSGGIVTQWSTTNDYTLTIAGNATVNCSADAQGISDYYGVRATNLNLLDNASINVKADLTENYSHIYGVYCKKDITLNTSGNLNIEVGSVRFYTFALIAETINVSKIGNILLKARFDNNTNCLVYPETAYNTLTSLQGCVIDEDLNATPENGYAVSLSVHYHSMAAASAKAPTCAKAGNNAYFCCTGCGKTFKDSAATQETTVAAETLPATGKHTYDSGKITKTTATTYTKTFTCKVCRKTYSKTYNKAANTLTVKAKSPTVKYVSLKKKNQTLDVKKALTVSKAKGTVTYAKASGNKKITVNKKTGKITVKKGLKKGTYTVKIKVNAAGNSTYKSKAKTVAVKIKVK